jgi:4,5-DOPA dioxygenase extradiol
MQPDEPSAMPAAFFGHGSPMNALDTNRYTAAWGQFGRTTPRPRAVLCVSAHWCTRGTAVTAMERPKTIHDFGGFPRALFDVQYPARGDPALAARVKQLLAPTPVVEDHSDWGLDHGAWSVLRHLFPQADIPVVQLSLDMQRPLAYHYELARHLAPLRDEGILVIGTGNIVHNLRTALRADGVAPFDWAARFSTLVRMRLLAKDHAGLVDMDSLGPDAALCIPTPEHYLPFLYVIALQRADDGIAFLTQGIELGSIDMMSIAVGAEPMR